MRRRPLSDEIRRAAWRGLRRGAIAAPIVFGCCFVVGYRLAANGGEPDWSVVLAFGVAGAADAAMLPPFVRVFRMIRSERRNGAPCPE